MLLLPLRPRLLLALLLLALLILPSCVASPAHGWPGCVAVGAGSGLGGRDGERLLPWLRQRHLLLMRCCPISLSLFEANLCLRQRC